MKEFEKILFLKRVESTQDVSRDWIRKYDFSPVIVASEQTKGRGQRNSYWQSNKGGLWFSLSLKNFSTFKDTLLPLMCSYAVLKAIENLVLQPMIKWPNDVVLLHKKVAGILVEKFSFNGSIYYICGFGINVNNEINIADIRYPAINLKSIIKKEININILLFSILETFEKVLENFSDNFFDMILKDINNKLFLKNEFVKIEKQNEIVYNAILDSIGSQGELIYILNGEYHSLYSGRITF
ncbi:biotin/acetyl-CoA-carboxylase ligase [Thermodesulfobium narugense DSM 14796]|uniref:Biotin/acetyl-CoA-carboxylase ligase n=1 Tax=Thermodesulfobium narugense DSM 14796 TaxID=747365 RepID=M1E7M1_9BACT|nr:biotin--[acetyl-CoA-carboxylase] ligase [Thermodesulfobium narugense]AEE14535.1 biotin/acetyl-CoA-carboxylase ligase [Thermodesulfobium narugense DSM 14796]